VFFDRRRPPEFAKTFEGKLYNELTTIEKNIAAATGDNPSLKTLHAATNAYAAIRHIRNAWTQTLFEF